jgi:hypothetical protein
VLNITLIWRRWWGKFSPEEAFRLFTQPRPKGDGQPCHPISIGTASAGMPEYPVFGEQIDLRNALRTVSVVGRLLRLNGISTKFELRFFYRNQPQSCAIACAVSAVVNYFTANNSPIGLLFAA